MEAACTQAHIGHEDYSDEAMLVVRKHHQMDGEEMMKSLDVSNPPAFLWTFFWLCCHGFFHFKIELRECNYHSSGFL